MYFKKLLIKEKRFFQNFGILKKKEDYIEKSK